MYKYNLSKRRFGRDMSMNLRCRRATSTADTADHFWYRRAYQHISWTLPFDCSSI